MAMDYDSEQYALMNTPIENDRHVARVVRFLSPESSDRILEVGCGRGFVTRRIQELAPETYGVDVNPQSIAHAVAPKLDAMPAGALRFPDGHFDKLYSFHMIEHIPDVAQAFTEMCRVVRPGGLLFFVYPAEPVRGLYAVPSAVMLFGNPLRAGELHVHRLTPTRVKELIAGTALQHVVSEFNFFITPQYMTLLRRRLPARALSETDPAAKAG
jgi:ubiquinone/menaquinone biosynthesis C-methylase UbiE